MNRREFVIRSGTLLGGLRLAPALHAVAAFSRDVEKVPESRISFETSDAVYQSVYSRALDVLAGNVTRVENYPAPVLIEGSNYRGIWLECAPQEGLVYSLIRPDAGRNNHLAFFLQQKDDGQIPCWIRTSGAGFGQMQMVVPIAATAYELAQATGDSELLDKAYASCSRWDGWLRRYRDTRKTGLCEGFCTWDTGHDNSPRWAGMPNRCPDGDARKCPEVSSLPRLCPDLSATVYGGRVALASMARVLGKNTEADKWLADAESIRSAIVDKLYGADDASFYDLDAQERFVRIRSDVISRVLGEHVVDQKLFDRIYERQIHNPKAFWAPYPLPSIALDDPAFIRPIPRNSWGGAAQALTALRAPRWMEYYGKPADLAYLMEQWVKAILGSGKFLQQMDPLSGAFTEDLVDYSPAALVFLDFTWRLSGVRVLENGLEWNVRPSAKEVRSRYRLRLSAIRFASIEYESGKASLILDNKVVCTTASTVRLVTDLNGNVQEAVGIGSRKEDVRLVLHSGQNRELSVAPNQKLRLQS